MATPKTTQAPSFAHAAATTAAHKATSNLSTGGGYLPASTVAAVSIKDCNRLLRTRLGYLLTRLRSAGCLVAFKRGKTLRNGANREVAYILLQDVSDLRCLDMVYAPGSVPYPDLRTATRQSVADYIQQFAQDVQSIYKLWAARQKYKVANGLAQIPNLAHLVKNCVAGISDVPSIWAFGKSIPAYDLSIYYFSESGLNDLYGALRNCKKVGHK